MVTTLHLSRTAEKPFGKLPRFLLLLILVGAPLWAESDRVMLGEPIFVAADEELNDVVCFGCSIQIEGKVGDAVAIGGSIEVDGEAGEAVAIGGGIEVRGSIRGDTVSVGGSINLSPGARIGGDSVSVGGAVNVPDGAEVAGEIVTSNRWAPMALSGLLFLLILSLIAALFIQPLLVLLCYAILGAERLEVLAETARQRAGLSFLLGGGLVVGSFVLSIVTGILPIPGPGLPSLLGLAMFIVLVVGYSGISYWVGRGLLPRSGPGAAAFLGAVLITLLQLIPVIGWLAFLIFSLMALGSAALSGFGTSIDWLTQRTAAEPVAPTGPS